MQLWNKQGAINLGNYQVDARQAIKSCTGDFASLSRGLFPNGPRACIAQFFSTSPDLVAVIMQWRGIIPKARSSLIRRTSLRHCCKFLRQSAAMWLCGSGQFRSDFIALSNHVINHIHIWADYKITRPNDSTFAEKSET